MRALALVVPERHVRARTRECVERRATDEALGRRRHYDFDVGTSSTKIANKLDGLVGSYSTTHADNDKSSVKI
jgi:hypothetical protein